MKKRIVSLALALSLILTLVPAAVTAADGDAPNLDAADTWAHGHINEGYAKGFIPASLQSNYKANITRGEFVTLAMSWLNYRTGKTNDQLVAEFAKFPDRAFTDTNDPIILAAAWLDITAGTGGTLFGPDQTFNRQQAAVMLTKVFIILGEEIGTQANYGFADLETAESWAQNAINFVGNNDVMSGKGGNRFAPWDTFQRQESIIVFNKIFIFVPVQLTKDNIDIREYTDAQLRDMLSWPADKLKAAINTRADAIAFLNIKFPSLWMSLHLWKEGSNHGLLRSGEALLNNEYTNQDGVCEAGRGDIATAVAYLLSDNGTVGSIFGFFFTEDYPIKAANYICLDGEYIVFDPVLRMDGDAISRKGELFFESTAASLDDYIKEIEKTSLSLQIDSIYAIEGGQQVDFTVNDGWTALDSPKVEPLFANKDKDMTDPTNMEKLYGHIIAENINLYKLPKILGGLTLTVDEAKVLVGASPETIKNGVKTAGDLLLYMLAARMLLKNGDATIFTGGYNWHYNPPARTVLAENLGNCGRMANLANFLLEDDYEEIGFINHNYNPGSGGGHVYSYIKYEGKYYIVDFSDYLFGNYSVSGEFNFIALDKLEDYGKRWNECFGGVASVIAYQSTGTDLPIIFGEDSGEAGIVYYPEGADYTILYETPGSGIEIRTRPCPPDVPDWTKPQ